VYAEIRDRLFTDEGQRTFLGIRDRAHKLLKEAGAFRLDHVTNGAVGDSWIHIACVDRLVELEEIREVRAEGATAGQHRVFVAMPW
jgi:hypothetical protein